MDRVARIRCMLSAALPAGVVGKTLRFLLDGRAVIPDEPAERARLAETLLGELAALTDKIAALRAQPGPARADRRRRAGGRRGPGQARRARPRGGLHGGAQGGSGRGRRGVSSPGATDAVVRRARPARRRAGRARRRGRRAAGRPRVCAGRGPSSGTSRWRSWPRSTTARARARQRLERVAHRHAPPTLALAGGGRFGGRCCGRGWTATGPRCAGSPTAVRAAARRCGLPTDARPYRPHLTLARAGRPAPDLAPLAAALDGFAGRPWSASDLHLVRSVLGAGPGGTAQHETLASWPLSGRS